MENKSLVEVLKAAVLAGLVAGALTAGFHLLLTEPVIDRAIEIEEKLSQAQGSPSEEPVVSRRTQRVGLILGFLLYGGAWGLLFGGLSYLLYSRLPQWTEIKRGFVLAVVLGWSVAVFPFLKYPANPPGVGDPETIGYRQGIYLGFIALSVLGTLLAFRLQHLISHRRPPGWPVVLALYVLYLAGVYLAMPSNPNSVKMPAQLVWTFRAVSLAGLILFWGVLGGLFGWLYREGAHRILDGGSSEVRQ